MLLSSLKLRRLTALLILIAGFACPAILAGLLNPAPVTRKIHVEAYRYGFSPSRIVVNRGDRLQLTFSTRDTGQSFFLQNYDLHVAIMPGDKRVSVQRLSRPHDPPQLVTEVGIVAGIHGWKGLLFSKSQFRNHTYNGPLHGTERGDLIVGPNFLLYGALGLLGAIPLAGFVLSKKVGGAHIAPGDRNRGSDPDLTDRRLNLFELLPWLKRLTRMPSLQFNLALPMLGVFWFIILAGLFGTKVSGRNAGPMIIWVLWLSALIILLVPIGGRIWCTACPLPLLGEWMQRRRFSRNPDELNSDSPRRLFGVPLVWPSWLSNAWPRVLLFLLLGTFSTTIVAVPAATSWVLIGLVVTAIVTSIFREQRIFCRYLCPISSFIGLYSKTGRLMVRSVSSQKCAECQEHFCLVGSVKGWGCPYGLCVGEIRRNNDCGICLECFRTCAYDNSALFLRTSGAETHVASHGEAWQAIVMFALACTYCVVNLGPWDTVRDWVDLVDRKNWGSFAVFSLVQWTVCLGVLPLLWYLLTRLGIWWSGSAREDAGQFRATTAALIPIGLGCWIAFALATVLSMSTFLLQSLSDPLGWGWDLLGMAGSPWHILWAPAIPSLQVACVLIGVAYSYKRLFNCWLEQPAQRRAAIIGSLPLGSFLWIAAAGMIYFFAG